LSPDGGEVIPCGGKFSVRPSILLNSSVHPWGEWRGEHSS
jgi:hypothetical protein